VVGSVPAEGILMPSPRYSVKFDPKDGALIQAWATIFGQTFAEFVTNTVMLRVNGLVPGVTESPLPPEAPAPPTVGYPTYDDSISPVISENEPDPPLEKYGIRPAWQGGTDRGLKKVQRQVISAAAKRVAES
jgi:hypothetical protein